MKECLCRTASWPAKSPLSLIMGQATQKWGMTAKFWLHVGAWLTCPFRFAGNDSPSFVFPTAIATRQSPGGSSNRPAPPSKPSFLASGGAGSGSSGNLAHKRGTDDLDFFIGDEAIQANAGAGYGIDYPIKHGIISDWSLMERYWEASIFKYLRCEPEDTYFLLVRPMHSMSLTNA